MVDLDESEDSSEENEDKIMPPPKPAACAKVLAKDQMFQTINLPIQTNRLKINF